MMRRLQSTDGEFAFGVELVLDLSGCDPAKISCHDTLVRFARELVDVIDMNAFGDPIVARGTLPEIIAEVVARYLTRDNQDTKATRDALVEDLIKALIGPPLAVRFALDNPAAAGFTLVQLIETSSIVAHFAEGPRTAHMNIFSCKTFDPQEAAAFVTKFFRATRSRQRVLIRGDDNERLET